MLQLIESSKRSRTRKPQTHRERFPGFIPSPGMGLFTRKVGGSAADRLARGKVDAGRIIKKFHGTAFHVVRLAQLHQRSCRNKEGNGVIPVKISRCFRGIECFLQLGGLDRHEADVDRFREPLGGVDRHGEVAELSALDADAGPVEDLDRPALLLVAARVGQVRLIDNTILQPAARPNPRGKAIQACSA